MGAWEGNMIIPKLEDLRFREKGATGENRRPLFQLFLAQCDLYSMIVKRCRFPT